MTGLAYETSSLSNSNQEEKDYEIFCKYLEESCGITLGDNKSYLVNSRLRTIKEHYGFNSLLELVNGIKSGQHRDLKVEVVDAMTTNETSWFRDNYPFEILKTEIFSELNTKLHTPKIWSAACSYGHEPYSISITFQEYIDKNPGQFSKGIEIVGTDISRRALTDAREGHYDDLGLSRGLSNERKQKFFTQTEEGMRVNDKIKQRVRFQEFNLLNSYSLLGQFDVIFCRNVLIYFSNENKSLILNKMAKSIRPNGCLFLGASEPIVNYCDDFEMVSANNMVYYRRK